MAEDDPRLDWPPDQIEATRAFLRERGATDRDLAVEPSDLPGVVLDLSMRSEATLDAHQMAERVGTTVTGVADIYHELGIVVGDPDEVRFHDVEIDLIEMLRSAVVDEFTPDEGHQLVVVLARSLRSIADASISGWVQTIEDRLLRSGGSLVEWAEATESGAEMAHRLGAAMGALFGHYLRQAAEHQRASQRDVSSRAVARVAVGFVDLVGFTPLSSSLEPEELGRMVGEFESRAFDLANDLGVRIVKHIGDEFMFTAVDPAAACRAAIRLRDELGPAATRPRGGIAHGEVITRLGDYYGPVVNLASRLTDEAIPGEILVPADLRDAVGGPASSPPGGGC